MDMSDDEQSKLAEQVKQLGFSTEISIPTSHKDRLVVYYNNTPVVCSFHTELSKTAKALEKSLIYAGADQKASRLFITYFTQEYLKSKKAESEVTSASASTSLIIDPKSPKGKKVEYAHKYSRVLDKDRKKVLHEAAVFTDSDEPVFIFYDREAKLVKAISYIEEKTRIIKPLVKEELYLPYAYANLDEINSCYLARATLSTTYDMLYRQALSFVKLFTTQDNSRQALIAVDIVWSYFQDKFATCHYPSVYARPGNGKSSTGQTFAAMGYRTIVMTDPSAANVFRIFGSLEPGQCTLVLDEAEKIDTSSEMMTALKNGYDKDGRIFRINNNTGEQKVFYCYGLKFILAEKPPKEWKAEGVIDRQLAWTSQRARTKYNDDIKKVMREEIKTHRQQMLYDNILDFRKLLLVFRLLHFNDPLPELDIGVIARERELCEPLIRLFYGAEAQDEIVDCLQTFLDEKNEVKRNAIDEVVYAVILDLAPKYFYQVVVDLFWSTLIEELEGKGSYNPEKDPSQKQKYEFSDFGLQYKSAISRNIKNTFAAKIKHTRAGNVLLFDKEKLVNFATIHSSEVTKILVRTLEDSVKV
jgi:hypothetical protein